jgi:hypothetical protein
MEGNTILPRIDDYPKKTKVTYLADAQQLLAFARRTGSALSRSGPSNGTTGGCPGRRGQNDCSDVVQNAWDQVDLAHDPPVRLELTHTVGGDDRRGRTVQHDQRGAIENEQQPVQQCSWGTESATDRITGAAGADAAGLRARHASRYAVPSRDPIAAASHCETRSGAGLC